MSELPNLASRGSMLSCWAVWLKATARARAKLFNRWEHDSQDCGGRSQAGEGVVEIGPGAGAITLAMARLRRLLAIELDQGLAGC